MNFRNVSFKTFKLKSKYSICNEICVGHWINLLEYLPNSVDQYGIMQFLRLLLKRAAVFAQSTFSKNNMDVPTWVFLCTRSSSVTTSNGTMRLSKFSRSFSRLIEDKPIRNICSYMEQTRSVSRAWSNTLIGAGNFVNYSTSLVEISFWLSNKKSIDKQFENK